MTVVQWLCGRALSHLVLQVMVVRRNCVGRRTVERLSQLPALGQTEDYWI